jgi:DtxR family transcriptional regulator, Mn-dependent transcriptional regulator
VPPHPQRKNAGSGATSPSMEQYVETIAELLTQGKVCSVSEIASVAKVSRPAASRAVRDLAEQDLVEHKTYGYVDLTSKGHALANKLAARHETLFRFFHEVLSMEVARADEEACRLEHLMDDDLIDRLSTLTEFLGNREDLSEELLRLLPTLEKVERK